MSTALDAPALISTYQVGGYLSVHRQTVSTECASGDETYAGPVKYYSHEFMDKVLATQPSTGFQAIAPTSRGLDIAPWFRRLDALREISHRWSEKADAPNATALHGARRVIELLFDFDICPSAITASCEGGVVVTFERESRQASIEADNDGDMLAVVSDGAGEPDAWVVAGEVGIRQTLSRFSAHLA